MKRILVVDDEAAITDGLTALFGIEQIVARGAYDCDGAVAALEQEFFPVILADVRLRTEEEGLRLLGRIRELSPKSKVASLTAFATPELEERLRAAGSSMVLRKPMEFEDIVSIVVELLESTVEEAGVESPEQLEAIYEDLNRMLYAIPQRRFGLSPDEADEIVQEAWMLFLEKRDWIRSVKPWLAGTMVNLSRQRIDRNVRQRSREEDLPEGSEVHCSVDAQASEETLAVRQALGCLDERSRLLCTLIGIEGYSYEEVASELGLPIGSVGPLYIRAKKRLRAMLETVN